MLSVTLASWKHIEIFGLCLPEHGGNLVESIRFLCSKWISIALPFLAGQYYAFDDVAHIGEVSELGARGDNCEFLILLNAVLPNVDKGEILLREHFAITIDVVEVDDNKIKAKPVSVAID